MAAARKGSDGAESQPAVPVVDDEGRFAYVTINRTESIVKVDLTTGETVARTDFSSAEAVRKYYFSLSGVVRTYVENRFGMNATDLTTEELVPLIQHDLPVESPLKNQLRSFLESTDAIKYAGSAAQESDIERVYEQALSFVEATVPKPEPQEEAAS